MLTKANSTPLQLKERYLLQLRGMLAKAERMGNRRLIHALRRLISRVYLHNGRVN